MKLYLDPGHGGSDPGATGNGLQEKEVVLELAKRIQALLLDYSNTKVKMSRSEDLTKSLRERTSEANRWGADLFLSIHCNAFNGRVRGYEDYIYNKLNRNAQTRNYQKILHQEIIKHHHLPNRGMKQANFHVLRESHMPAILTENGFIDHPEDANLMKQDSWKDNIAKGHVEGLVRIFQLSKKPSGQEVYIVVAGSFKKRTNAEGRAILLEAKGFPARILPVTIGTERMFRVQAGRYRNKHAAKQQVQRLYLAGLESFLLKKND